MAYKKLTFSFLFIILLAGAVGISAFAPDARGAHSRITQELVLEVPAWLQVNSNGFGDQQTREVSALEAFDGYLYAGTHNPIDPEPIFDGAQIFRSSDGVTWTPVIDPGFGNSHDIAPPAILDFTIFNGYLYASTGRGNASQIWRTLNGTTWAPMDVTGFSDPDNVDITCLTEFSGKIYAGVTNQVNGAQIWSSFTGDNNSWTQVAPAVPGTDPASVTGFAEFGGALYAAVESEAPAQIWRSYGGAWETIVSDGFGNSDTTALGGIVEFAGYLYAGAGNAVNGAQLWRTSDGETWEQVIDPGFGDSNNQKVEMVFVHQNYLYTSVENTATGIELWRSADGSLWEQANLDGFGDSNNSGTNWSNATAEFQSRLYVGTLNVADGGELWQMLQNEADLALIKIDAQDPITLGDTIVYTITVSNTGPDPAQNVVLTDNLPAEVSYVSATPDQGTCGEASGEVTCSLGDLSNAGSIGVEIIVTSLTVGVITNQASVTTDTVDPNSANNTASENTTVDPILQKTYIPLVLAR